MGVSGFLISCARRRATSPQACARCAETISEMSLKTNSLVASGSSAPPTTRLVVCLARPAACGLQLERLLPVVEPMAFVVAEKGLEMALNRCRKLGQPRHLGHRPA